MNDTDSLKMELEVTRHNRDRDVECVIRQRDQARAEVERLTRERDEAKASADQWEYRAGDWMVRCEDAEGALTDMVPKSHAEKVLVAVAKEAAKVGAEDMREKLAEHFLALAKDARDSALASSFRDGAATWEWARITFERCASEAKNWRPQESP